MYFLLQAVFIGRDQLIPDNAQKVNVRGGCEAPDLCNTVNCPASSQCVDLWDAHQCQCDQGKHLLLYLFDLTPASLLTPCSKH